MSLVDGNISLAKVGDSILTAGGVRAQQKDGVARLQATHGARPPVVGRRRQPKQRKMTVRANLIRRKAAMNGVKDTKCHSRKGKNNKATRGVRQMTFGVKLDRGRPKGKLKMHGARVLTTKMVRTATGGVTEHQHTKVVREEMHGARIPTIEE